MPRSIPLFLDYLIATAALPNFNRLFEFKTQSRFGRKNNFFVAGKCSTASAGAGTRYCSNSCAFTTAGQRSNQRPRAGATANESR
jgi:hypothetical protein